MGERRECKPAFQSEGSPREGKVGSGPPHLDFYVIWHQVWMLEYLLKVYCSTHVPKQHSSFVPVIVSDKEYPKGTCLAPSFFIVGEREVIALFLKKYESKLKKSLLCNANIFFLLLLLLKKILITKKWFFYLFYYHYKFNFWWLYHGQQGIKVKQDRDNQKEMNEWSMSWNMFREVHPTLEFCNMQNQIWVVLCWMCFIVEMIFDLIYLAFHPFVLFSQT